MSWWIEIYDDPDTLIHDCPNCGGHHKPSEEVFSVNVTYNVSKMLRYAGLHKEILDDKDVEYVLPIVDAAYRLMRMNRGFFTQFEAPVQPDGTKWGTYDTTIDAVEKFWQALKVASKTNIVRWY